MRELVPDNSILTRKLLGSSKSKTSLPIKRAEARAHRDFHPPERLEYGPSITPLVKPRPSKTDHALEVVVLESTLRHP
jgi:hypothetical protein